MKATWVGDSMANAKPRVLRVDGPIIIDFGNGVRFHISPVNGATSTPAPVPAPVRGRPGRKPSPATVTLVRAMQADAAAGRPRGRQEYLRVLREAGGPASDNAAGIVINREAKRIFGASLSRVVKGRRAGGRAGKRGPKSPATEKLRAKLAADKEAGDLRDAQYYIRWLVDQDDLKLGLMKARPIAYRELRVARES